MKGKRKRKKEMEKEKEEKKEKGREEEKRRAPQSSLFSSCPVIWELSVNFPAPSIFGTMLCLARRINTQGCEVTTRCP